MAQFTYVITDEVGIHARPAGLLVKAAKAAGCSVTISKGEKTADASKLMAVMSLGVKKGDEVTVAADDENALENLKKFFEENL